MLIHDPKYAESSHKEIWKADYGVATLAKGSGYVEELIQTCVESGKKTMGVLEVLNAGEGKTLWDLRTKWYYGKAFTIVVEPTDVETGLDVRDWIKELGGQKYSDVDDSGAVEAWVHNYADCEEYKKY